MTTGPSRAEQTGLRSGSLSPQTPSFYALVTTKLMEDHVWRHASPSDVNQGRVTQGRCSLNTNKRNAGITFRLNQSKTVGKLTT